MSPPVQTGPAQPAPTAHDSATYDYIVIGSGAAGSILAARLTEDPGVTVCVLEAGPPDRHPYIHLPAGFIKLLYEQDLIWQFKTEPSEGSGGRPVPATQGRMLGGSSSINGMIYNRGQRADFDNWAQRGNRGWGYVDILPYFKRTERRIGGVDETFRGRDGKIPVTDMDWIHPISEAFIEGAVGMGLPRNPDYNGASQAGVGYFQRTIHRGWRRGAARMFLHPARARPTLDVRTHARAAAILLDGKRATGVRYIHDRARTEHVVHARREVIVSCGSANTARLLQISGIGPGALLQSLGAPVLHDLPGVGENLRDHYAVRFMVRAKNGRTMNELGSGVGLLGQVARWAVGKPSILALTPANVYWFWKSNETLDDPDLQGLFTPASRTGRYKGMFDPFPGMTAAVWQHRPESVGHVRARSLDPFEDPVIQPNYLAHPNDRQVLLAGMRLARRLMRSPEMARYFDREEQPGDDAQSDEDLLEYARQFGSSPYHLIGTARMGPRSDPTAVVDDELRVHGLQGLRVVDASIMPNIPSANTYAPTMMIAEKASDMIRGRPPLAPVEGVVTTPAPMLRPIRDHALA